MTDDEYTPYDSFDFELVNTVAEAIFTGILYGGSATEWYGLPERGSIYSKGMMRNGAIDVLRALRTEGVDV